MVDKIYKHIIVEKKDGVAKITMNRPDKLNALMSEMNFEIISALRDLDLDDSVRVVILTGAGRAFSAGGDINQMQEKYYKLDGLELRRTLQQGVKTVVSTIWNMEKPIIAAVNGPATGAACNIAFACDIVIASENARFGEVFIRVGLGPDGGGSYLLPRLVGIHKAKELFFTGRIFDAKEALQLGLVNRVVPSEELDSTVMDFAKELVQRPARALGVAKKAINEALNMSMEQTLDYEMTLQSLCFQTDENKELVKEFLEKKRKKD
ncbi:MAG: enoyl-CoA hydratase/isomerase family protein [Candidatus Jordarchaeum sp.]|uniref:enoyl-CoA hydratase/isomerase family protein n=1 Tax=Candidatus Jordarchaeum sp. TaxID=2823881 RepID=UPI00404A7192